VEEQTQEFRCIVPASTRTPVAACLTSVSRLWGSTAGQTRGRLAGSAQVEREQGARMTVEWAVRYEVALVVLREGLVRFERT
jgi:hypothetical protein